MNNLNMEIQADYFNKNEKPQPITLNTKFHEWYENKLSSSSKQENFVYIEKLQFIEGNCELKYYYECKSLQIYSFELNKAFQNKNIITNFCKNILQNKNYEIDYIVIFDVHYKEVKKFLNNGWSSKCYGKRTHSNIYQNIYMENENYQFKNSLHKCNCKEDEIFIEKQSSSFTKEEIALIKMQEEEIYKMYLFFFSFFVFVCLIGKCIQNDN